MYVVSNYSVTYVTVFSKGVHCLRKIITVSVATGTTLSSQATDNFITLSPAFCDTSYRPSRLPEDVPRS